MNNILVTGCKGQLGSELRQIAPYYEDKFLFHFTDKEELDITKREEVSSFIESNNINFVVNCAAFTAVDKAESEPELCDLLNHKAAEYLAEAAAAVGGAVIHISTDYVFDGNAYLPYKEDDPTSPKTVYGHTKLKGEEAVIRNCPGSMVIRTAWLYSTYGNNFVKTMLRLGKEKESLGVVFDQIGTPTYARDLAKTIMHIISKGVVPGVFHYTNNGVCSWYDFAKAVHKLGGIQQCHLKPLHTEEYPVPAKRPHYSVLDKTKIQNTFKIDIPWWQDSLKDCIEAL